MKNINFPQPEELKDEDLTTRPSDLEEIEEPEPVNKPSDNLPEE